MATVIPKQDQSIFDIAIQCYGDASKVYQIVQDNNLDNIHTDITGKTLTYTDPLSSLTNNFRVNKTLITTGTPKIALSTVTAVVIRSFSLSFAMSFR
jgi:hypothetical protein